MKGQATAILGKGGVFDSPRIRTKDDPIQVLFDPAAVFPAHRVHDQSGQSSPAGHLSQELVMP
jgi:hypothetical protein